MDPRGQWLETLFFTCWKPLQLGGCLVALLALFFFASREGNMTEVDMTKNIHYAYIGLTGMVGSPTHGQLPSLFRCSIQIELDSLTT